MVVCAGADDCVGLLADGGPVGGGVGGAVGVAGVFVDGTIGAVGALRWWWSRASCQPERDDHSAGNQHSLAYQTGATVPDVVDVHPVVGEPIVRAAVSSIWLRVW